MVFNHRSALEPAVWLLFGASVVEASITQKLKGYEPHHMHVSATRRLEDDDPTAKEKSPSPVPKENPTVAPTVAKDAATSPPSKSPSADTQETTTRPTTKDVATDAPSKAPPVKTDSPTQAPSKQNDTTTTAAPSAAPKKNETPATTAPTPPPTKAPSTSTPQPSTARPTFSLEELCKEATTCAECKLRAEELPDETKVCWFVEEICMLKDKGSEPIEEMCQSKPVTTNAPSGAPRIDPSPTTTPSDEDGDEYSDNILPPTALYSGIFLIVICLLFFIRRCSPQRQQKRPENTQYQTIATEDEPEDDWGWGEEDNGTPAYGDIELARKKSDDSPSFRKSSPPAVKSMPLRSSAAKKPSPFSQSPASTFQHHSTQSTPVPKKSTPGVVIPKKNDFFTEMGLSSDNSKNARPVKKLGAKALPMNDDDMNFDDADDWGDDDDLDDLLFD